MHGNSAQQIFHFAAKALLQICLHITGKSERRNDRAFLNTRGRHLYNTLEKRVSPIANDLLTSERNI